MIGSKSAKAVKPQPKPTTQAVKLPSHLTAPTASSAAKHEKPEKGPPATAAAASKAPKAAFRASLASAKPPTTATKSSLARSNSTATKASRPSTSRSVAADEGFLARMMRPTAASSSKVHEKTDVKSTPPRRTGSILRPRTNGHVKGRTTQAEKALAGGPNESGDAAKVLKGSGSAAPVKDDEATTGDVPAPANATSTPDNREGIVPSQSLAETPAFDVGNIR